jgi:hypothetical protein
VAVAVADVCSFSDTKIHSSILAAVAVSSATNYLFYQYVNNTPTILHVLSIYLLSYLAIFLSSQLLRQRSCDCKILCVCVCV